MEKGFKVFNSDWTCRGFQFEVGKAYQENVVPECCKRGFHYCEVAADCFKYYNFDSKNKVAEIEALGTIDKNNDDSKCCTDIIKIVREVSWQELLTIVNSGKNCTGFKNSGNYNSGDYNSGNHNSGNHNSGYRNSGDYNSGDYNSGYRNSGDYNSGYRNSGNYNSGNHNSGNYNSGDRNSGDYNSTNFSSGCFNTLKSKIMFFDKESNMTYLDWRSSESFRLLRKIKYNVVEWITESSMSVEEKNENPSYKTTGGYLKVLDESECVKIWWEELNDEEKSIIRSMPNYDEEKFFKILGINL